MFGTKNAITFVDIVDNFANNIGIVLGAILSIIWVTRLNRGLLPKLINHINAISSVKVGFVWTFMLTVVTPLVLIVTLALSLQSLFKEGYGGYPSDVLLTYGWGVVIVCAIVALVLPRIKGHHTHEE